MPIHCYCNNVANFRKTWDLARLPKVTTLTYTCECSILQTANSNQPISSEGPDSFRYRLIKCVHTNSFFDLLVIGKSFLASCCSSLLASAPCVSKLITDQSAPGL